MCFSAVPFYVALFSVWYKCLLVLCWELWDSVCFYRWIDFDLFSFFLFLPAGPGDSLLLLAWNGGTVQSSGTPAEVKLKEGFDKWMEKMHKCFWGQARWWMGYAYRCMKDSIAMFGLIHFILFYYKTSKDVCCFIIWTIIFTFKYLFWSAIFSYVFL